MKLLYVTFHELNPAAGVTKKILDQVGAFQKNGVQTSLLAIYSDNDKRSAKIDNEELSEISHGIKGQIQIRRLYRKIIEYVESNYINTLYIRYTQEADPFYVDFLKKCKRLGCKILLEIPTYPYEGECAKQSLVLKTQILVERYFRNRLRHYVDFIVTTSDFDTILGIKTIKISNAVNADNIPLVSNKNNQNKLTLISVATISFWHGLDRIILGLENYYSRKPQKEVKLLIVGGGDPVTLLKVQNLIKKTKLQSYVDYVGPRFGNDLNNYYNAADIAVGCLACHRKNIVEVKSLKNVDYAMRGLPMFYSENNSDFDDMPFVYKVPADDTPIDVNSIVDFFNSLSMTSKEIRDSVKHLTWNEQIKKILSQL